MLKLAPAALWKVTAWRQLVMRSIGERPVVEDGIARHPERNVAAGRGHAVPARGNPDDQFVHSSARAEEMAETRSSAIICGPAASAARP